MANDHHPPATEHRRVYVYRGSLSPLTGLLVLAPLLLFFFSLLAAVLVGGVVAALVLPFLLRWRPAQPRQPSDCIELDPEQYRRIDEDPSRRSSA